MCVAQPLSAVIQAQRAAIARGRADYHAVIATHTRNHGTRPGTLRI